MTLSREDGSKLVREMLGDAHIGRIEKHIASGEFGSKMAELTLRVPFGEAWVRPGLDRRSRILMTISILIALRMPDQLKYHVEGAVNNGFTPEDIEEVIIQSAVYAGWPAAGVGMAAAAKKLKEIGLI